MVIEIKKGNLLKNVSKIHMVGLQDVGQFRRKVGTSVSDDPAPCLPSSHGSPFLADHNADLITPLEWFMVLEGTVEDNIIKMVF